MKTKLTAIFFLVMVIVCCLSGCSAKIPEFTTEDVWVCHYPYIYMYYDEAKDNVIGKISVGDTSLEFFMRQDVTGNYMGFTDIDYIHERENSDIPNYFGGDVEYKNGVLICEITSNDAKIFGGVFPKLEFKRYNKEEYIREHGEL